MTQLALIPLLFVRKSNHQSMYLPSRRNPPLPHRPKIQKYCLDDDDHHCAAAGRGRQCLEKEHLLYSSTPPPLLRRPPAALRQYVRRRRLAPPHQQIVVSMLVFSGALIHMYLYIDGGIYREPGRTNRYFTAKID